MAVTLINSVATGPGPNGGDTAAIVTTGADFILVVTSFWSGLVPTFSDSKLNTWLTRPIQPGGSGLNQQAAYCFGPTVGSGHTFRVVSGTGYYGIIVLAFSGMTTFQYDTMNGLNGTSVSSPASTGSVTPLWNGALIVTTIVPNVGTLPTALDASGFSVVSLQGVGGNNWPQAVGYQIQNPRAAINPAWTWTGGTPYDMAAMTLSFSPPPVERVRKTIVLAS